MSATLPNLNMLAEWLHADFYVTDYRPVPLTELIRVGGEFYDRNDNRVDKSLQYGTVRGDEDGVIPLCVETIRQGIFSFQNFSFLEFP